MASYMFFHVVPDSHLEFLREHPETFLPYMEGREPMMRRSMLDKLLGRETCLNLPEDWPTEEPEGFSPEVNHRQVQDFHYLLNGTKERVGHSGCIFQTWFAPRHKTVTITIDGENFALASEQVLDLKERIETLSDEELLARHQGLGYTELPDPDKQFLKDVFSEIHAACDKALEKRAGLMWTAG
jgi:hypothetical protein